MDTDRVRGIAKKKREKETKIRYCSFKTFGGTEVEKNGTKVIENTAIIETWYTPDIRAKDAIEVGGVEYEILGTPENINMRNQFMQFKVKAVKGGC